MIASGAVPAPLPAHIGVSQTSQIIVQSRLCRHPATARAGTPAGTGDQTASTRKIAVVAGAFFLITEITAVAGRLLYNPVLSRPGYIADSGADTRVFLGALSEVILAIAVIGTAVTLYPIVKRQNEGVVLGYVCGRLLEAVIIIIIIIVVGIISVLSVVTLRHDLAGAAGRTVGKSLVAIHNWTFLLGAALILGVNTLLAYLMYRSGLVPRFIAVLGLIGGP